MRHNGKRSSQDKIDVPVGTTSLLESFYGTLTIGMDKQNGVTKIEGLQHVKKELDGECFQPADVIARDLPLWLQMKGCPNLTDEDTNSPGCRHVDKNLVILDKTSQAQQTDAEWGFGQDS